MDVSPRDAASRILEATCLRVPVSSAGSSLQTIQNCTQESGGFGGEHEEYQQFGCVCFYANPFELQWASS